MNELLGHNVSGKTFNRFIKNKKALDEKRINYIRWMVDTYYETENREEQWKACRTAINKSIRNNELKGSNEVTHFDKTTNNNEDMISISANPINTNNINLRIISLNESVPTNTTQTSLITLEPNMSIFQMSNDLDLVLNKTQSNQSNLNLVQGKTKITNLVTLTNVQDSPIQDENNAYVFKEGLKIFLMIKNVFF